MHTFRTTVRGLLLSLLLVSVYPQICPAADSNKISDLTTASTNLSQAERLFKNRNYNDALKKYQTILIQNREFSSTAFTAAVKCLQLLRRYDQTDAFIQRVISQYPSNWLCYKTASNLYQKTLQHTGYIQNNTFHRGRNRNYTTWIDTTRLDHLQALAYLQQAKDLLLQTESTPQERSDIFFTLAELYIADINPENSIRLLLKSDYTHIPPYTKSPSYPELRSSGAPVTASNTPYFFKLPQNEEDANNDGELFRYYLQQSSNSTSTERRKLLTLARFSQTLYGVQTLSHYYYNNQEEKPYIARLSSLAKDRSIARLESGVQEFSLPPTYSYLEIFQKLADKKPTTQLLTAIATEYENRRQYTRAADTWRRIINLPKTTAQEKATAVKHLQQIEGSFLQFESSQIQSTNNPTLHLRFRNSEKVQITARKINTTRIIRFIIESLKKRGRLQNSDLLNIQDIGWLLANGRYWQYLSDIIYEDELDLQTVQPEIPHGEERVQINLPANLKGGAYFVEATLQNGYTTNLVLWLSDLALSAKSLISGEELLFTTDSYNGSALDGTIINIFGYYPHHSHQIDSTKENFIQTTLTTNKDGIALIPQQKIIRDYQYLISATSKDGRTAFLGFDQLFHHDYHPNNDDKERIFYITDKPLYRPGEEVKIAGWVKPSDYTAQNTTPAEILEFNVTVHNPKGDKILTTKISPAPDGSFTFKFKSSTTSQSGVWYLNTDSKLTAEGNYFRLEEYKKPEFTVELTPDKHSTTLTQPLRFKVHAQYIFGKPLANAKVEYTIHRQPHTSFYQPTKAWDWLYGAGYQQLQNTSQKRELYRFIPHAITEPELLDTATLYTDEDGNAEITLKPDTLPSSKKNQSWEFTCEARVTDNSQRNIRATTSVILQNTEFSLSLDTDQNYYYPGETIALCATPVSNNQPLNTKLPSLLTINIYKNTENDGSVLINSYKDIPQSKDLSFKRDLTIAQSGYYTLECLTHDRQQQNVTSTMNIYVCAKDPTTILNLPSAELQLIPKKKEYTKGESAELLLINQNPGSTQLLFSGINSYRYPLPKVIPAKHNYSLITYKIKEEDCPNTFMEVLANTDEEIVTATAELFIPPKAKMLKLKITPEKSDYPPSGTARVTLHATDNNNRPVTARAVVTVFDNALSALPFSQNYPNIAKFFWGLTHQHSPHTRSSLNRFSYNLYPDITPPLQPIGMFGGLFNTPPTTLPIKIKSRKLMANTEMIDVSEATFKAGAAGDSSMEQSTTAESNSSDIRTNFTTGAYFTHSIKFDNSGKAVIDFPLPDSLTTWKIKVWAMSESAQVGQADSSFTTSKALMLVPSLPRYLISGDNCSLNTTIFNNSASDRRVSLSLTPTKDLTLNSKKIQDITLPAESSDTLFWSLVAGKPDTATIDITAKSATIKDAVSLPLEIIERGQTLYQSRTTLCRTPEYHTNFNIPAKIKPGSATLNLQMFPTLQSFLVKVADSLPEDRIKTNDTIFTSFLPKVILDPAYTTNVNKRHTIQSKQQAALSLLAKNQNPDGGWNWIGTSKRSNVYITSLILRSLEIADQAGVYIPAQLITGARLFLIAHEKEQTILLQNFKQQKRHNSPMKEYSSNLDALIYATLSLSGNENKNMRLFLFRDRNNLSVNGLSLFATGLYYNKCIKLLPKVLKNISQYLITDTENDTAFLDLSNSGFWWYWYNSEAETTANYLTLRILAGEDQSINDRLAHYLINNIKHLTRADSIHKVVSILSALELYRKNNHENAEPQESIITLNDEYTHTLNTTESKQPEPLSISFSNDKLHSGENELKLSRVDNTDTSPLYLSYTLSYFSQEPLPKANGLELKTRRQYYRLIPQRQRYLLPNGKGGEKELLEQSYLREELRPGDKILAGDLIETELTLTSKNDYEYIYIQDNKPACLEPVENRSGFQYNGLPYYVEYRDRYIQYYVESMPRGTYSFTSRAYTLFSGTFTAPAATSSGVFASELNSNSTGFVFNVKHTKTRKEEEE